MIWLLLALLASTGQLLTAQTPGVTETRVTKIDLKSLGWQPPQPQHPGELVTAGQPLTIDHAGRILIGFTVLVRKDLVTREHPAFSYHILRIAPDGKVDFSAEAPTNNWNQNGVYLDQVDDIIVRANDMLQMLRVADQTTAGKHDWVSLSQCGPRCDIRQSVSRGTLICLDLNNVPPVTVFQGSPPHIVKSCQEATSRFHSASFTDAFAYWLTGGGRPLPSPVLHRAPLCESEDDVVAPVSSGDLGAVSPLGDESFVISGFNHDKVNEKVVSVVSASGITKFRVGLPKNDQPELVQASESGNRFAVSIATWGHGFRALDISGNRTARHIAVYDSTTGNQLVSFPITPRSLIHLAISPDGRRVAVLADDTLTVADVP